MVLNLYKPAGITSHDAVNFIRRLTGERRVGHGGTLDPFAEGVLVIGVGRESTKKLHQVLKEANKEYIATLELGKTSTTGDPEGEIKITASREKIAEINTERLAMTFHRFTGEIEQTPPAYSALKIKGVPAYKLARRGKAVSLPKRKVLIKELELLEFIPHPSTKGEGPLVKMRTVVSSGTYIRALVEDIGKALGVGAYLQALVRTRVGEFKIEEAKNLGELEKQFRVLR